MRPVLHSDVTSAARVLMGYPIDARAAVIADLLTKAQAADLHRKRTGRAHPLWGNGSLMAVALNGERLGEADMGSEHYLECLLTVIEALLWRK